MSTIQDERFEETCKYAERSCKQGDCNVKLLSEAEMDCEFICITDKDLMQYKFWKIQMNRLDINSLFSRMEIFSDHKN